MAIERVVRRRTRHVRCQMLVQLLLPAAQIPSVMAMLRRQPRQREKDVMMFPSAAKRTRSAAAAPLQRAAWLQQAHPACSHLMTKAERLERKRCHRLGRDYGVLKAWRAWVRRR